MSSGGTYSPALLISTSNLSCFALKLVRKPLHFPVQQAQMQQVIKCPRTAEHSHTSGARASMTIRVVDMAMENALRDVETPVDERNREFEESKAPQRPEHSRERRELEQHVGRRAGAVGLLHR